MARRKRSRVVKMGWGLKNKYLVGEDILADPLIKKRRRIVFGKPREAEYGVYDPDEGRFVFPSFTFEATLEKATEKAARVRKRMREAGEKAEGAAYAPEIRQAERRARLARQEVEPAPEPARPIRRRRRREPVAEIEWAEDGKKRRIAIPQENLLRARGRADRQEVMRLLSTPEAQERRRQRGAEIEERQRSRWQERHTVKEAIALLPTIAGQQFTIDGVHKVNIDDPFDATEYIKRIYARKEARTGEPQHFDPENEMFLEALEKTFPEGIRGKVEWPHIPRVPLGRRIMPREFRPEEDWDIPGLEEPVEKVLSPGTQKVKELFINQKGRGLPYERAVELFGHYLGRDFIASIYAGERATGEDEPIRERAPDVRIPWEDRPLGERWKAPWFVPTSARVAREAVRKIRRR